MKKCDNIKELLVLYSEMELSEEQNQEIAAHLSTCEACSEEARKIHTIHEWLGDAELFKPAQTLAWQKLPQRLASRIGSLSRQKGWNPVNRGSFVWALSLAASLVLAVGLIWMVNREAPVSPGRIEIAAASGNEAFLNRMQSIYAREVTVKYLGECQDLLVNLVRAEQSCAGDMYDVSLEVIHARQLLHRKRMLDVELALPEVARAKSLCDEIEGLLVNLSTAGECETSDQVERMERYIEKEQLLLRISLLQSELS